MSDSEDPYAQLPPVDGLSAVVAVGRDGVIGRENTLPWHIPEDLAHFRLVTRGHTLVMGSATWASIARPLPGRRIVVLSRRDLQLPDTVERAATPEIALALALAYDPAPVVAGGSAVYELFMPQIRRVYRTDVDVDVPGADAHFAALSPAEWVQVDERSGRAPGLIYRVFDRRP